MKTTVKNLGGLFLLLALQTGCAVLHHVQVGQIDNRSSSGAVAIPFEVMVSETGVSTQEIGALGRAANSGGGKDLEKAAAILSLFQMGPSTGNLVYNATYAEKMVYEIHQKCPTGRVTGLMSIREMRKYPVISGEIVKVTGFCLKDRAQPKKGDI